MSVTDLRIVVIGGGIMGASVAYALGTRGVGRSTTVIERGSFGNGFSSMSTGIVRCHYGHPALVSMALRSRRVFQQAVRLLDAEIGFHPVGYVLGTGSIDKDALLRNVFMQRDVGVNVELLGAHDVAQAWPGIENSGLEHFAFEPEGGYGDAYLTTQAFVAAARRQGAVMLHHQRIARLVVDRDGSGIRGVELASGEVVGADVVVVAAGPWSVSLCEAIGLFVPVVCHREQKLVLSFPAVTLTRPVLADRLRAQYLRPDSRATVIYGSTRTDKLDVVEPDDFVSSADDDFLASAGEALFQLFGTDKIGVMRSYAGCYDLTPDLYPIIGPCPVQGLILCVGFSGHGFKLSPAIGELVADLILDGVSSDPLVPSDLFHLSRFQLGREIHSSNPYSGSRY